jgi:hypothetical protein
MDDSRACLLDWPAANLTERTPMAPVSSMDNARSAADMLDCWILGGHQRRRTDIDILGVPSAPPDLTSG